MAYSRGLLGLAASAGTAIYIICERELFRRAASPVAPAVANDYWLAMILAPLLLGYGDVTPPNLRELLNIANCYDVRRKFVSRRSKSANLSTDLRLG